MTDVSRIEGRKGLDSNEDCVNASIQGLEEYIKMSPENLIKVARDINDK